VADSKTEDYVQPLWDSSEAAHYLRVHPRTLTRMARDGEIPAIPIGRQWRFRKSDLDAWLESRISSLPKLKSLSASTQKGDVL
jgi:nitrogen PTS system EIIA component